MVLAAVLHAANIVASIARHANQVGNGRAAVVGRVAGLTTRWPQRAGECEAHRLLADTHWDGGCLEAIVKTILKPYSERARVSGGGVRLTPRAAQTMCMVINELATNAAKYGALSKAEWPR